MIQAKAIWQDPTYCSVEHLKGAQIGSRLTHTFKSRQKSLLGKHFNLLSLFVSDKEKKLYHWLLGPVS
jgi:hypothetical protein